MDCVIGLQVACDPATLRAVAAAAREAMSALDPGARGVLVFSEATREGRAPPRLLPLEGSIADVTDPEAARAAEHVPLPFDRSGTARGILEAARRLGARSCALVSADPSGIGADWIAALVAPVLQGDVDCCAPYYARHRFGGAITSGIAYPFSRALYGMRLRFPLGADVACSRGFVDRCLAARWPPELARLGPEAWLLAQALTGKLRICQTALGPRTPLPTEAEDLTTTLSRALGALFLEAERHVAVWQRVRGSQPVEVCGGSASAGPDPVTVDVRRFLEAFRIGEQNLERVWGVALPPASLLQLRRMAAKPDGEVRFDDALWARIVYDFALAHRVRAISRDHLLAAFTPLYLGWLGAFASELGEADADRIEERIEELCIRFEAEKPYLISRWRWPDRFSP